MVNDMELNKLFKRCTEIHYIHLEENCADFAYEIIDGVLYLYFQSSNCDHDWKNNFSFWVKPYKDMETSWYCHSGFLRVWKTIEPYIQGVFDGFYKKEVAVSPFDSVVIVGYSHGAAIASICHEWVWFHYPEVRDKMFGVGFGCPRVYWNWFWIFKKELRERWENFFPVQNSRDIVAHLPPVLFGFRHVNKVIKIKFDSYGPIKSHYPENYQLASDKFVAVATGTNFKKNKR